MHIAIVNLTSGGLSGGYRKYLEQLVPLLHSDPRVTGLDVFIPAGVADTIDIGPTPSHAWPAKHIRGGSAWLKNAVRRLQPDVVFIPTARWLDCGEIPLMVMVRNMEPLTVPFEGNSIPEGIRNLARAYVARQACRRATRVVAVSEHVRDFLVKEWRVESQKIGVVYHGVKPPTGQDNASKPKNLQLNDSANFIFTAGSLRPARGLEDVIRALSVLRKKGRKLTLVIAGEVNSGTKFYKERMQRLAVELGVDDELVWTGHLNSREISWCFFNCAAFVMTSRAEACPNVVLEALAHGCLCVSTTRVPMPEFFLNLARYYEAADARGLADQLAAVVDLSAAEKHALRSAASGRAMDFTWETAAFETVSQLELAIENNRG